jgi:hypothetical protein
MSSSHAPSSSPTASPSGTERRGAAQRAAKEARKERNRASAERSRIRKKQTSQATLAWARHLEADNRGLQERIDCLSQLLQTLRRAVGVEYCLPLSLSAGAAEACGVSDLV